MEKTPKTEEKRNSKQNSDSKPKKKSNGKKLTKQQKQKRYIMIGCYVAAMLLVGIIAFNFAYSIANDVPVDNKPGKDITVEITEGMSASKVGAMLVEKGVIKNKTQFVINIKLNKQDKILKPGKYILNTSNTVNEIINDIRSGPEKDISKDSSKTTEESSEASD